MHFSKNGRPIYTRMYEEDGTMSVNGRVHVRGGMLAHSFSAQSRSVEAICFLH